MFYGFTGFMFSLTTNNNHRLVFEEKGKPQYPEKNLSEQTREPTNMMQSLGIDPGPYLVGGATAPALLTND